MTKISDYTVRRLSMYSRILEDLVADRIDVISSAKLAELSGTNSAQVRKDLSYFGNFGKRGSGYRVEALRTRIRSILGVDRVWRVVLVGAGNLGSALFSYKDFSRHGFQIVAILENDPTKVGKKWDGIDISSVSDAERIVQETGAEVAIVTTPPSSAQDVVQKLTAAGIRGVLNFAPSKLEVPEGVELRNVNITIELEGLSFSMRDADHAENTKNVD